MTNVKIDPCNQSGETVMGRRAVMRVDPVSGGERPKATRIRGKPSRARFRLQSYDSSSGRGLRPGRALPTRQCSLIQEREVRARPLHDRTNPGRSARHCAGPVLRNVQTLQQTGPGPFAWRHNNRECLIGFQDLDIHITALNHLLARRLPATPDAKEVHDERNGIHAADAGSGGRRDLSTSER